MKDVAEIRSRQLPGHLSWSGVLARFVVGGFLLSERKLRQEGKDDRDLSVTMDCELDSGFQSEWRVNESRVEGVGNDNLHRR